MTQETTETKEPTVLDLATQAAQGQDAASVDLLNSAESFTIANGEELGGSEDLLRRIKGQAGTLDAARKKITGPMDEAKKEIMDLFRPAVKRLKDAEGVIKDAILAYTRVEERKRIAAQAKLDEDARRERVQLEEQAAKHRETGREGRAETLERRAEAVEAPTVAPADLPKGGVHLRQTWKAEVKDLKALARAVADGTAPEVYLMANMVELNRMAREMKGDLQIPGVEAVAEEGVAARA